MNSTVTNVSGTNTSKQPRHALNSLSRKKPSLECNSLEMQSSVSSPHPLLGGGERKVNKFCLPKPLSLPYGTTVLDACQKMTMRRVDAALLTDFNSLLCGIITDKDVAIRVIAEGLKPEETVVSKVMTPNPVFVAGDTLALEAVQKMVQGKFRHLPVVENGEVIAVLDITRCLYDVIVRLESSEERGKAIAIAIEDVERQLSSSLSCEASAFDMTQGKSFGTSLGAIDTNSRTAILSPLDTVRTAAKKMNELQVSSVIITKTKKTRGILTSKDIMTRVVVQKLPPDSTTIDKVMTFNPECVKADKTLLDALHAMHDGKFLHLPVLSRGGHVVACLDILQLVDAAMAMLSCKSKSNDAESKTTQKDMGSALEWEPPQVEDGNSQACASRVDGDTSRLDSDFLPSKSRATSASRSFAFKVKDPEGLMHRFECGSESLAELLSTIEERIGHQIKSDTPHQLLYEDEEGDRVILVSDSDLVAAVNHARLCGWKALRLHLGCMESRILNYQSGMVRPNAGFGFEMEHREDQISPYTIYVAGATAAAIGLSMLMYVNRPNT